MLRLPLLTGILALAACGSAGLKNGVYRDGAHSYRLAPPQAGWSQASFAENDLAWTADSGQVIAVNSTCEDHGDPSLKVLTDHMLLGFEDRAVAAQEELQLDGRGALRSRLTARLDGVPIELELTVLKKDGCVYDFTYSAPTGRFEERLEDYRRLVASFASGSP